MAAERASIASGISSRRLSAQVAGLWDGFGNKFPKRLEAAIRAAFLSFVRLPLPLLCGLAQRKLV